MKRYKLQKRMLYFNVLIVMGLAIIGFVLLTYTYTKNNERLFQTTVNDKANTSSEGLAKLLFFVDNSSLQISYNPFVLSTFTESFFDDDSNNYFSLEAKDRNTIYSLLMPYLAKDEYINRICLYNRSGDFIAVGNITDYKDTLDHLSPNYFIKLTDQLSTSSYIITTSDYDAFNLSSNTDGYLSFVRPIISLSTKNNPTIGYVEVQIPLNNIKSNLLPPSDGEFFELYNNHINFMTLGTMIHDTDYTVSRDIPDYPTLNLSIKANNSNKNTLLFSTLPIIALILLVIALLLIFIQKMMIQHITEPLTELCEQIQLEDFDGQIHIINDNRLYEVNTLYNSFNAALFRLHNTLDELVTAKTSAIESQMLALQSQVDPHFIHNTLSIISALSEEGDKDKVKQTINGLSTMIRYSSDYSTQEVKLLDEFNHIKSYLELLKIRYEEDFTYEIIGENKIGDIRVPKFILQPLVENTVKHSLKLHAYPWKVYVRFEQNKNGWKLLIIDNGYGIDDQDALRLHEQIQSIHQQNIGEHLKDIKIGGFSLINSIMRLKLMYPNEIVFDIFRNTYGGTTVSLGRTLSEPKTLEE